MRAQNRRRKDTHFQAFCGGKGFKEFRVQGVCAGGLSVRRS